MLVLSHCEKTVEVCPLPSMMHDLPEVLIGANVVIKDSLSKTIGVPEYALFSRAVSIVREEFLRPAFGPQLIREQWV
ncbi:hypothetical protein CEXT_14301 [Caerostris extrusa]|uniref:Uncharacterized protein n=1 Tax=Caerostris extrusa TaxID=172846 RepID=A0AAV4R824_CAEEX|nr:hypothetical protein CEXT_14301 [Caerostris extrusa]